MSDQAPTPPVNSFEDNRDDPSEDKFPMFSNIMKPYDYKIKKKFMDIEMELARKLEKNKRVNLVTTIATPVFDNRKEIVSFLSLFCYSILYLIFLSILINRMSLEKYSSRTS